MVYRGQLNGFSEIPLWLDATRKSRGATEEASLSGKSMDETEKVAA